MMVALLDAVRHTSNKFSMFSSKFQASALQLLLQLFDSIIFRFRIKFGTRNSVIFSKHSQRSHRSTTPASHSVLDIRETGWMLCFVCLSLAGGLQFETTNIRNAIEFAMTVVDCHSLVMK